MAIEQEYLSDSVVNEELSFLNGPTPTPTLITPSDPPLPNSRPTTARSLNPTPLTTPVFLQPPLPAQPMPDGLTYLPMPLQNNVFVVATYDRQKAIELCGPALADVSREDFVVSRKFIHCSGTFR